MKPSSWWIPLVFAIAAAAVNFIVLRSGVEPVPLVVPKVDLKAGQILKEQDLTTIPVSANADALQSILHYADIGRVIEKKITRDLKAGELLLLRDVRPSVEDVSSLLQANEATLTLMVPGQRIATGLRPGDQIVCLVTEMSQGDVQRPTGNIVRVGPFRVLALDLPVVPTGQSEETVPRKLTLAAKIVEAGTPPKPTLEPGATTILMLRGPRGNDERIQGIERFRVAGQPAPAPVPQPN